MFPMFPMYGMRFPNILKLSNDYDQPPTVYAILNSYCNYSNDNPVKISDLAKTGRAVFFDFTYPLATGWNKEDFESMILNHFLMRRIGYDTVTAFKIALNVKLNEIMPSYNKLYTAIEGWNLFNDGESIQRYTNDSTSTSSSNAGHVTTDDTVDNRFSNTPQQQLDDVRDGKYVNEYTYNQSTGESDSTDNTISTGNSNSSETITRTPSDKIRIYQEFLSARQNLYTMIFRDLEDLFYQIAS